LYAVESLEPLVVLVEVVGPLEDLVVVVVEGEEVHLVVVVVVGAEVSLVHRCVRERTLISQLVYPYHLHFPEPSLAFVQSHILVLQQVLNVEFVAFL
jgi:hypothetical protein